MERTRSLVAGVLVVAGIFGAVMVLRIVSRALWAATRLLETLGVLALAVAAGWVAYRVLVGDAHDPRITAAAHATATDESRDCDDPGGTDELRETDEPRENDEPRETDELRETVEDLDEGAEDA